MSFSELLADEVGSQADPRAAALRRSLGDRVILAGDPGYDAARVPWNVAVDQRPFAVARPETAEEVVAVVRAATEAGLRVAPQSTGHAAAALADTDLGDAVLVSLAGLRGVTVHADSRTAIVLGGSLWNDVVAAAAPHGLTALHGSAGDVSVVGYLLSGGLSFYARTHGLGVNSVRAVQLVTADGSLVRAGADENADLFWAVRGGSGAFGVVVSIEIDLLPYADVFAGMLLWDASHAPAVVREWARWSSTAPESATTALRVMSFPPLPELPPFLSGRSVVVIDGAILETDAEASVLLEPLRALAPEMDTFARIPAAGLVGVHMDPPAPTPAVTSHAVLGALPDEAVEAFLAAASTPGLFVAELRQLGGAIARRAAEGGAVSALAGDYIVHGIAITPVPEVVPAATGAVRGLVDALEPWTIDALALTFIDGGVDRAPGFGESLGRLRELKAEWDPRNVFAAGQPLA
jgi:FAD/FMN-containing dehydrogenase